VNNSANAGSVAPGGAGTPPSPAAGAGSRTRNRPVRNSMDYLWTPGGINTSPRQRDAGRVHLLRRCPKARDDKAEPSTQAAVPCAPQLFRDSQPIPYYTSGHLIDRAVASTPVRWRSFPTKPWWNDPPGAR